MSSDSQSTQLEAVKQLIEGGRFDEAYVRCLPLAEAGSTPAQIRLGWMYQAGKGVQKDLEEAKRWYTRAIRSESPKAEFCLATVCWEKRDAQQTIEWLERSAAKGYAPAMYELGRMYNVGYGVPEDTRKGLEYTERAARKGHLFARRTVARDMLIGHRGLGRIPRGLFAFVSVLWAGFRIGRKDPYDDLVFTLRRHTKRDI